MTRFQPAQHHGAALWRRVTLKSLIILTALALSPDAANAADGGWRVGGDLILPGDSKARVLRHAGAPDLRETLYAREGGVVGERWYYSRAGHDALTRILTFRAGQLVRIRTEYD